MYDELIQSELPEFKKAVEKAQAENGSRIMMTLGAFSDTESSLMWKALKFANDHGVAVLIAPTAPPGFDKV